MRTSSSSSRKRRLYLAILDPNASGNTLLEKQHRPLPHRQRRSRLQVAGQISAFAAETKTERVMSEVLLHCDARPSKPRRMSVCPHLDQSKTSLWNVSRREENFRLRD